MSLRREKRGAVAVVAAVAVVIAAGAWMDRRSAAGRRPRRPSSDASWDASWDADVLARVPVRAHDPSAAARARLRRTLRDDGRDLAAATELARLEIEAARASGDPRPLAHAEAALAGWWTEARPPAAVLLLRATIRQARHEFTAALADLDRVLVEAPDDEQALLTRAVVLGVLGRYREAIESCGRLTSRGEPASSARRVPSRGVRDPLRVPTKLTSAFVVAACRAPLFGVTGRARQAARELADSLGAATSPGERAWGLSLLGEIARWSGDERAAETLLRGALALRPDDAYTRGVLAELLRDGGRGDEARAFATPIDAQTRQELAREHWRSQREPGDARVLLETAVATNDRAGAAPVLAWLDETGFEWPRLRRLADQLRSAP